MKTFATATAVVAAGVIAAFAGLAAADAAKPGTTPPTFTDQEVLDAAYAFANGGQKTHPGAYSENLGDDSLYYVNTVSIGAGGGWVELCSDHAGQAAGWAQTTNERGSEQRTLRRIGETDKFFEFTYEGTGDVVRMRVHKCAYAAPTIDQLAGGFVWGAFNGSLAKDGGKEFAQYQWFVKNYGRYDGSLLATVGGNAKGGSGDVFDLYEAYVAEAGGPGMCDQVALAKTTVVIDRDRTVRMSTQVLRTLEGECHPGWS